MSIITVSFTKIKRIIGKIKEELSECIKIAKRFGFGYGLGYFFYKCVYYRIHIELGRRQYYEFVCRWLKRNYYDVYDCALVKDKSSDIIEENVIWVMWWQGEASMPASIYTTIHSLRENNSDKKIIIITRENYFRYITIPEKMLKKVDNAEMKVCYLADYIRFKLLSLYGGVWVDASVLHTAPIDATFFDSYFYTIRHGKDIPICLGKWSIFAIAGQRGNNLFIKMSNLLEHYWDNEKCAITYFLTDCFLRVCYENDDEIKEMIDKVPVNNTDVFSYTQDVMNTSASTYMYKTKWR